jgi:hypothetical protein
LEHTLAESRSSNRSEQAIFRRRPPQPIPTFYLQVTMAEQLIQRGTLEGHSGWVTALATSLEKSVLEMFIQLAQPR